MRYFIQLSYKGTHYRGWQQQAKVVSVQGTLIEAVAKMTHQRAHIQGCGRTDAGVHATRYYAHIDLPEGVFDNYDPVDRINRILPTSIRVLSWIQVADSADAQLHATSRTYRYLFHNYPSPFLEDTSYYLPELDKLDASAIDKALEILKEQRDFRALCIQPERHPHTRCKIYEAQFVRSDKGGYFEFTASRFLRKMVRLTVRNLLDVGLGILSVDDFRKHLIVDQSFERQLAIQPHGLHLWDVSYPFFSADSTQGILLGDKMINFAPAKKIKQHGINIRN